MREIFSRIGCEPVISLRVIRADSGGEKNSGEAVANHPGVSASDQWHSDEDEDSKRTDTQFQ